MYFLHSFLLSCFSFSLLFSSCLLSSLFFGCLLSSLFMYCNPGNLTKLINLVNYWRFWHSILKLLNFISGSVLHYTLILKNQLVKAINFHKFQELTNNTKINRLRKFPGLQYFLLSLLSSAACFLRFSSLVLVFSLFWHSDDGITPHALTDGRVRTSMFFSALALQALCRALRNLVFLVNNYSRSTFLCTSSNSLILSLLSFSSCCLYLSSISCNSFSHRIFFIWDSNRERKRTNADLEDKIRERRWLNVSPLGLHQWNKIRGGAGTPSDLIPLMKPWWWNVWPSSPRSSLINYLVL